MYRNLATAALAFTLAACGDSSPGPLQGTWQAAGLFPVTATFRSGEMESMGLIDKVGYKVDGNSVIVTAKDGALKGTSVRYVFVGANTVQSMGITFKKVGN